MTAIMANSWWEIKIRCEPMLEELIFWRLDTFGFQGMVSEAKGSLLILRAYLPQIQAHVLDLAALSLRLRQDALILRLPRPGIKWHLIDEEDWASSWKKYWEPQKIGDRILIQPAWLPPPKISDRVMIKLDPGAAFGTGTHQTTQLCLESLEMRLSPNTQENGVILDIGCGSGILSLGAIVLGAQKVYAVDIDPLAVRATHSNRELNGISSEQLMVAEGTFKDALRLAKEPIDGILCNILAEVVVELIPQMSMIAQPSTWGILSGILLNQVKPVADTLEEHGWIVATLWKRDDWCVFNVRRDNT